MDVFVIEQVIDLSGVNMPMIYRQALTQHDAYAHEWRVSVKKHGHAVDLTGCTAQIYFGPENKTGDGIVPGEALTQRAVAQGGAAYAQLLPELYQIDGRVMAIMQISDPEDHVMTAAVLRLHTSGVLEGDIGDPSGSVIELGALLAQLDELRTQTAAAREAAQTANTAAGNANTAAENANAAESERVAAEEYRVGHESTRQMHENDRVQHEKTRISSETTRRTAETAREEAETARNDAETARAEAEQQRAAAEEARDAAETDRESAEQARAAAEQARQETFAGYEKRIVAATPDDTTVDGRAWSSKKTVDSLCMPLEATGNPVQVYPVEGYPLGVKVSWEPTQAGSGDPSPDNIRPIVGRDVVSVERCGTKNLLDMSKCVPALPPQTYGLSVTIDGDTIHLSGVPNISKDENNAFFKLFKITQNALLENVSAIRLTVFDANFEYKRVYYSGDGYVVLNMKLLYGQELDCTFRVMMSFGTPTAYEPYTGSITDIALPETVYGGTLDVETGVVTVDRRFLSFDGTENWYLNTGRFFLGDVIEQGIADASAYAISSHAQLNYSIDFSEHGTFCVRYFNTRAGWVGFAMSNMGNVDDFKTYLAEQYAAGTPVQVCYNLQMPYTIQLEKNQITALSGVNTLYTDAGTLTVTGREDPRHTIVTLTDRIAALESAAAGV